VAGLLALGELRKHWQQAGGLSIGRLRIPLDCFHFFHCKAVAGKRDTVVRGSSFNLKELKNKHVSSQKADLLTLDVFVVGNFTRWTIVASLEGLCSEFCK